MVHHRLDSRQFGLRHPRGDQRSAAAHALDKNLRVFLVDAGMGQRTQQTAGDAADCHATQHSRKPSGADDGGDTRNRQHGDEAGSGCRCRADRSPDGRPLDLAIGLPALLPPLSFCKGTTLAFFAALYQVSELFEITLVSDGGRPAASSATITRWASGYES